LFQKKPSEVEVYNDFGEYGFAYKFLKEASEDTLKRLEKLNWHPSETLWNRLKASQPKDDFERFRKFVYVTYYSYGKKQDSSFDQANIHNFDYTKFRRLKERLKNVIIYKQDYKNILKKYDSKDTLFYFDPPYHNNWKKDFGLNKFDLNEFRRILDTIKGKFIVSYSNTPKSHKLFEPYNIKLIYVDRQLQSPEKYKDTELLIFNFVPKETKTWIAYEEELDDFEIEYLDEDVNKDYNQYRSVPNVVLDEFVLIPDFISLTGSTVYGKHIPNDVDIVIRIPQGVFDEIFNHNRDIIDGLILKLERIFNKKIHLVPSSIGANWSNVSLYDLVLKPKNKLQINEINEKDFQSHHYFQELRATSPEIQKQAEESKKEDKIKMFRFFFPEKVSLQAIEAYRVGELYNVDQVIDYYTKLGWKNKLDFQPFVAQKKYDGNRAVIFKDKDKVKIFSDDGKEVNYDRLQGLINEIKSIKQPSNFVLDCEIELWKNGRHQNREDTTGFLHSKGEAKDDGIIANCFDCLYINDNDIHKEDITQRIAELKKIPFPQSTIDIPNTKFHLNLSPSFFVSKPEEVSPVLNKLANSPASEGAMLKVNGYSLNGYTTNMIKYKKYAELHTIVLDRNTTKVPTIYNYEIGLRFDSDDNINPAHIQKLGDNEYLHIGRTYNTNVKCEPGDVITVRFHTLNLEQTKNGNSLHIYEPIFYEKHPEAIDPDSFKTAIQIGENSGLLVKKEKFIENLETYDPKNIKDDRVLIDDFRLLLAFYSSGKTKYNQDLIKSKFKEVLTELLKRGKFVFRPDLYKDKAKELFYDTLKEIVKGGVYLTNPFAKEVIDGKKTLIVKARPFENMLDKPLYLCDNKYVYGVIKLK